MVTSSGPAEGKSTTIANLAVVTAQGEKKTLLIDADLRRPTAHHTFDLANRQGLTTVIAGQASLADVVQKTSEPMLDIVTAGPIPPNPAEMLASNAMSRIMSEASRHYDQIFYDCPPVIAVTDAQILASKVDGVIFVIDAGRTNKELALKAKNLLAIAQANVLGAVLNNKKMGRDSAYYYYYGRGK